MIDVKNLTVSAGGVKILDNVSVKLRPGTVYGLICGDSERSAIFDALTGCVLPDAGEILVNGDDIFKKPKKAKAQIGYLPEKPPVFGDLTVGEYLAFIAEAKGTAGRRINQQVRKFTELCGLDGIRNRLCAGLTPDEALRAGLAQAMIGNPDTVFINADIGGMEHILAECGTAVVYCRSAEDANKFCGVILTVADGLLTASEAAPENSDAVCEEVEI